MSHCPPFLIGICPHVTIFLLFLRFFLTTQFLHFSIHLPFLYAEKLSEISKCLRVKRVLAVVFSNSYSRAAEGSFENEANETAYSIGGSRRDSPLLQQLFPGRAGWLSALVCRQRVPVLEPARSKQLSFITCSELPRGAIGPLCLMSAAVARAGWRARARRACRQSTPANFG